MSEKKSSLPMKVYLRPRPSGSTENKTSIIRHITPREIVIKNGPTDKKYIFDHVFNENASQLEVYETAVAPYVSSIPEGYTCTVFAYGQTGTGKTHTMFGEHDLGLDCDLRTDTSIGIILRATQQLFIALGKLNEKTDYTVRFSFIQIIKEEVLDLLDDSTPLRVYDDPLSKSSAYTKSMAKLTVFNVDDVNEWINVGKKSLTKNGGGSHSHLMIIFSVDIRERTFNGAERLRAGRLNFIELAGSENMVRPSQQRAKDFSVLNKSLITFGNVIKALEQKLQYVPYRESKLTRLLQDSLGGSAKVCMIATFFPNSHHIDETINTLELATAAKSVVNCPQVNVCKKQTDVSKELQDEIARLRNQLTAARSGQGFYLTAHSYNKLTQEQKDEDKKVIERLRQIHELQEHNRTLKAQYAKENESFLRTKMYIEDTEKRLKEKQYKTKEKETLLDVLTERNKEMIQNASRMLDICEKTLKEEAIIYKKYQEKCQSNTSNTNVAQQIVETTTTGIKDIEQATITYASEQQSRIKDQPEFKNEPTDVQPIMDMACSIENFKTLDAQQLVNNDSDCCNKAHVAEFINMVHTNITEKLIIPDEIKGKWEEVKKSTISVDEENKQKVAECVAKIANLHIVGRDSYDEVLNFLNQLLFDWDAREDAIRSEIREVQCMLSFLRSQVAREAAEKKALQEEAAELEASMKFIETELANRKDVTEFEQTVNREMMSIPNKTNLLFNNLGNDQVIEQFVKLENEFHSGASYQQQMVDERAGELLETLKSHLADYNNHIDETFSKVQKDADTVKTSVLEKTIKDCTSVEKIITAANEENADYFSKTKNIIKQTLNKLEPYDKKICFMGHVGDTPVKNSHTRFDPEDIENVASSSNGDDHDREKK
ncbi:kinesin-like protein Klp61F [Tribolium madens]|uniref:kinesin-like protein Klp61F n=1 Tax=Tribolium madens TaxID=41895 RepID=UPI001CF7217F|nr:kinesin-like protein Klp61F [Tribolium madens]